MEEGKICVKTVGMKVFNVHHGAHNLGAGRLTGSTLLAKLNAGDYAGARAELLKWDKAGGEVSPGILRRREAEAGLWV